MLRDVGVNENGTKYSVGLLKVDPVRLFWYPSLTITDFLDEENAI